VDGIDDFVILPELSKIDKLWNKQLYVYGGSGKYVRVGKFTLEELYQSFKERYDREREPDYMVWKGELVGVPKNLCRCSASKAYINGGVNPQFGPAFCICNLD
jgi:N-acetylneuraminic acid mutarotase